MAVAIPVRRPKQSDRLAATLYSPPETWTSNERAFRKGITPGSSRWTSAPRERKSSSHASLRTFKPLMDVPLVRVHEGFRRKTGTFGVQRPSLGHVDEDLKGLLLFQQPHHLVVVLQPGDRVGQDPLGDAGIGVLSVREGLDAQL